MSREIKFRAWHKLANYMCYNATTDFLDRDHLKFMQYTGLKDKNGKEIYEGDIVEISEKHIGKIEIGAYGIWLESNDSNVCGYLIDLDRRCNSFTPIEKLIEIIGNIYNDSELLNNKLEN